MTGKILIIPRYYRQDIRREKDWLFVFGDNMVKRGLGGQAAECRGEPNVVGIPTKWAPSMNPGALFKDSDFSKVKDAIDEAFFTLENHLKSGGLVVWPKDGVGTGRARLSTDAPTILEYIEGRYLVLESIVNE